MAWIALCGQTENQFSMNGLGARALNSSLQGHSASRNGLLTKGSIVIETHLSPEGRPQTLLSYRRSHPWVSSLSLQAIPGGGLSLVITQGDEIFHTALNHDATGRTDVLRITYSWDAPNRWGRLAVERPERDQVTMIELTNPKPMAIADLQLMASDPTQRRMDRDVIYFAVSTEIEPLGPMPGLAENVPVLTSKGYQLIGGLRRGDLVLSSRGDLVPVLCKVSRSVPARGRFEPLRLRAPYFGLRQDIMVAPEQRLVITGTDVEYLFGKEAVLVPVRHLADGTSVRTCEAPTVVTYTQLILPGHETIQAAGCPLESLYIGRIRRKPDALEASLLAGIDRNILPEHAKPVYPVLQPYEAISLAKQRAA